MFSAESNLRNRWRLSKTLSENIFLKIDENLKIETQILEERKKKALKLLIIGPGESGKSTIVKQVRILHCGGYSVEEKRALKHGIYINILEGIDEIHWAIMWRQLIYENPSSIECLNQIRIFTKQFNKTGETENVLCKDIIKSIQMYIKDETVAMMLRNKTVYNIEDSTIHFIENLARVIGKEYLPTGEDILKTRVPTLGIAQYEANIKHLTFK